MGYTRAMAPRLGMVIYVICCIIACLFILMAPFQLAVGGGGAASFQLVLGIFFWWVGRSAYRVLSEPPA